MRKFLLLQLKPFFWVCSLFASTLFHAGNSAAEAPSISADQVISAIESSDMSRCQALYDASNTDYYNFKGNKDYYLNRFIVVLSQGLDYHLYKHLGLRDLAKAEGKMKEILVKDWLVQSILANKAHFDYGRKISDDDKRHCDDFAYKMSHSKYTSGYSVEILNHADAIIQSLTKTQKVAAHQKDVESCLYHSAHPDDPKLPAQYSGSSFKKLDAAKTLTDCTMVYNADVDFYGPSDKAWVLYNTARAYNKQKNYKASLDLSREAAKLGHAMGYYFVGLHYRYGEGVEKDLDEAIRQMEKARDLGVKTATAGIADIRKEAAKAAQ